MATRAMPWLQMCVTPPMPFVEHQSRYNFTPTRSMVSTWNSTLPTQRVRGDGKQNRAVVASRG